MLICLKSNILQDVCVEGGGAVSSQLRVAVSREDFKKALLTIHMNMFLFERTIYK